MGRTLLTLEAVATTMVACVLVARTGSLSADSLPKETVIPLKSLYATSGQEGLRPVKIQQEEPYGYDLGQLHRDSHGMGASNTFLVKGKDIAAAVKATRLVFTGGRRAGVPVTGERDLHSKDCWLVAYLGTGPSTPPPWVIESVTRKGFTIRVTYSEPRRARSTRDVHQSFLWVPLGPLEPGTYSLELFDSGKGQVTLQRRVTTPQE
jgi:hypothetical protein